MFQVSIISVRPSVDARELTINQTPNKNFTVVGRLYEIDSDSKIGVAVADKVLEANGGGRVTIVMNNDTAADLTQRAQTLYDFEQTPFYVLTFAVKALKNSQEGIQGYNMTLDALEFLNVEASPIEPDMLNDVFNNAPNHDAAIRSADAYAAGVERRALQSQVVAAGQEAVKRSGRGRKPKSEVNA